MFKLKQNQQGVAVIEVTLVLPILCLLCFATVEFGRMLYQYNALTKAVRDASRYIISHSRNGTTIIDINELTRSNATALLTYGDVNSANTLQLLPNLAETTINIDVNGEFITLTASYPWQPIWGDSLPAFVNDTSFDLSFPLVATYTMMGARMIYKNKKGVYSVEFAIAAAVFFILLFAVIEGARLMYTWNVLTEVSRRGARLATVCNLLSDTSNPQSITQPVGVLNAATFADAPLIPISTANINISYLDLNGATATTFSDIELVRAEIVNYQHQLLIPFFSITLNSPSFSTTLPVESLGVTRYGYTDCLE